MTPLDVVAAQLEAYNDHDVERFAQCFAPQVIAYDLISHSPLLRSRDELAHRYDDFFAAHPGVQAQLLARVTIGAAIVDTELVVGLPKSRKAVAIYEVDGGLIHRFWLL